MKARKLLATLLALAMTLSMLSVGALAAETENEKNGVMPISETGETAPVSNLPADAAASWAASSIERWTATGIVKGDGNGNFNPNAQLTRGELAKIFEAMFGLTVKAENTFGDLNGSEWYADAVLKCVAAGIMKGDGVNANAENNISRGETIVMFGRAVGVTPDEKPDLSKFTDGASVADWAAGYLAPLTKMGILSGSGDGTINAVGNIDRASVMSLLDKSVAEYVNAPGEYKVDDANKFVVVNMSAKEGEIIISGTTAGVTVSAGTAEGKIVAKDLKTDTIKMDGAAALNVEGKSTVGEVVANATGTVTIAKGVTVDTVTANSTGTVANAGTVNSIVANGAATVSNTGTVKELVANAPAKVDNKGTITKADIKADGVILDGKKPTEVKVDEGTKNPTDSNGNEIKPVTPPSGNTGGPSGPSSTASKLDAEVVAVPNKFDANGGWANAPEINRVSPTYTTNGYTIKATGAVNEVTGFTGFSSVEADQQGYYVTVRIVIPSVAYDTEDAVIWYSKDFDKSKPGTVFKNDPDHCLDLIMRVGAIGATSLKNFQFKVDWDGAKSDYSAQTYTVDLSELVPVNAAQETALAAVNAATKDTMATVLTTHATTLGINLDTYNGMHESRQPSVCQYVIDSKSYITPAAVKAAFDMGVKYEAAKWALSTKILENTATVADFTTLKTVYEAHAAYRASIGKSLAADPGYLAAISAMTHVTADFITAVQAKFEDNTGGVNSGTNAYRLNEVFAYINTLVVAADATAPTVSAITTGTNFIQFTATDNVGVKEIEIDSQVYTGATGETSLYEFDFNIALPITEDMTTQAETYGMTITITGDVYKIAITDYSKFAAALQTANNSDDYPTKIHFYVVAKDAKGNPSGHMGFPGTAATAQQCDLTLTLPDTLEATSKDMLTAALALTDGGTVKLGGDISSTETIIVENTTATLDLNGYTLKNTNGARADGSTLALTKASKITIMDSSADANGENGSGEIDSTANNAVVIEGNIENGDDRASIATELTVKSGTLGGQEGGIYIRGKGAKLVVDGGTFTGVDNSAIGGNGTKNETNDFGGTTIIINAGTITSNTVSNGYRNCGLYHPQAGELVITGGTITGTNGAGIVMRSGSLTMTGGTVEGKGTGGAGFGTGDALPTYCGGVEIGYGAKYPGGMGNVNISGDAVVTSEGAGPLMLVGDKQQSDNSTVTVNGITLKDKSTAHELTGVELDREGEYVTYTLKNSNADFLIAMDTVSAIGKKDETLVTMYELWETGTGAATSKANVEMTPTAGDEPNHNNGWTLKTSGVEQTWYFWDMSGNAYYFTATPNAVIAE